MKATAKVILISLILLLAGGCHRSQPLYAPPAVLGDLLVNVYNAKVKNGHVWVKMHVYNGSDKPVLIDRNGFGLRLPNGSVIKRAYGITSRHTPYLVAPRARQRVFVDFRGPEHLASTQDMFLIVGGIRQKGELKPHVAGEVPLVGNYDRIAPPPMSPGLEERRAAKSKGAPEVEPAAADEADAEPSQPAARKRLTVAVDLGGLDDESYERIEGVELEKQLIVRLVQDGFAVVSPSEEADAMLTLGMAEKTLVLRVQGGDRGASRSIADTGQDRGILHHELVQKASALVYQHAAPKTAASEPAAPETTASETAAPEPAAPESDKN